MTFDERQAWEHLVASTRSRRTFAANEVARWEERLRTAKDDYHRDNLRTHLADAKQHLTELDAILAADVELIRLRNSSTSQVG